MSFLYTYGTGSNYESKRWSVVQNLLDQVKDNNANLIYANHVRDAIFTLWERTNEVEIIAVSASLATHFQNPNPTTIGVGGISVGTTFSTQQTLQQLFDLLLYPYTQPQFDLTGFHNHPFADKEYGQNPNTTAYWYVNKKSNNIVSINVDGQSIIPNGNVQQNSTKTITGSYSSISYSTHNNFLMTVNDGHTNYTISTGYFWKNRLYCGYLDLSSIFNPDFTTNPSLLTSVTMDSSTILGLDISKLFSGGGNDSSIDTIENFDMSAEGKYLVFAWSSYIPYATEPKFKVNGVRNTAFSNIKTGWDFVNVYGATSSYEVWISNTPQYSPLEIELKFGPSILEFYP